MFGADFLSRAETFAQLNFNDSQIWMQLSDFPSHDPSQLIRSGSSEIDPSASCFSKMTSTRHTDLTITSSGDVAVTLTTGDKVSLHALTQSAIAILQQTPHFTQEAREQGKLVAQHIDEIYDAYDHSLKEAPLVVKIARFIRDLFERCVSSFGDRRGVAIRLDWGGDNGFRSHFTRYTQDQYADAFPQPHYTPKLGEGYVMEEIDPDLFPLLTIKEKLAKGDLTPDQALFSALASKEESYFKELLAQTQFDRFDVRLAHLLILSAKLGLDTITKHLCETYHTQMLPQAFTRAYIYANRLDCQKVDGRENRGGVLKWHYRLASRHHAG